MVPFIGFGCYTSYCHFTSKLDSCNVALHGTSLENAPETSVHPKCSSRAIAGDEGIQISYHPSAERFVLGYPFVSGHNFQSVVFYLKDIWLAARVLGLPLPILLTASEYLLQALLPVLLP